MKELTMDEMAEIHGGMSKGEALCNIGFIQFGMWNSIAFSLAFTTPLGIALVAVGAAAFSVGSMFLCDAITS